MRVEHARATNPAAHQRIDYLTVLEPHLDVVAQAHPGDRVGEVGHAVSVPAPLLWLDPRAEIADLNERFVGGATKVGRHVVIHDLAGPALQGRDCLIVEVLAFRYALLKYLSRVLFWLHYKQLVVQVVLKTNHLRQKLFVLISEWIERLHLRAGLLKSWIVIFLLFEQRLQGLFPFPLHVQLHLLERLVVLPFHLQLMQHVDFLFLDLADLFVKALHFVLLSTLFLQLP